jgi:hypothetical protein
MKYVCIGLVKLYQMTLSKILPPVCRFTPSCSAYAVTAFERYGVFKGGYFAFRRILRCHPWNAGGIDYVP